LWKDGRELYQVYEFLYGGSSTLVLASGEKVASIKSGVRQGDALAGLFFNLGIMAVLKDAAEVAPSVIIMFYLDDGNLLGASGEVKRAVMSIVMGFAKIGLRIHPNKSIWYDGQLGMILALGTARILRATRSKVRHRAREGAVAMDEFDGFFDAAEGAPGLGVGFEDEDEHARLDAGILNLDVGAGNMGAAVEGAEDAAAGEVGHPPFIFPHGDVADGVGGPQVH
jgi:hypothetical protein